MRHGLSETATHFTIIAGTVCKFCVTLSVREDGVPVGKKNMAVERACSCWHAMCAAAAVMILALAGQSLAVAQTPPTPAKTCPACADYAKQLAVIDEQIGKLQRSNASLRQGNQNDPGVQKALKEDEAKIAKLQDQRNGLAAKKSECERKCAQPTGATTPTAPAQPTPTPPPKQTAPAPTPTPMPQQPTPPRCRTPAEEKEIADLEQQQIPIRQDSYDRDIGAGRSPDALNELNRLKTRLSDLKKLGVCPAADTTVPQPVLPPFRAEPPPSKSAVAMQPGGFGQQGIPYPILNCGAVVGGTLIGPGPGVTEIYGVPSPEHTYDPTLTGTYGELPQQTPPTMPNLAPGTTPIPTPSATGGTFAPYVPLRVTPPPPLAPTGKPAQALLTVDEPNTACHFYFGGGGGFAHLGTRDTVTHFDDGIGRDRDRFTDGFAALLRAGVQQGPVRLEGEFAYRRNGLGAINGIGDDVSGSMQAFTFMANGIYDFELPPEFMGVTPHVGAGIGVAHLVAHQKIGDFTILDSSDTQFAYQGIAGLRVPLGPGFAVDFDYRYLGTTDPSFRNPAGNRVTTSYGTHNFLASFIFEISPPPPPPVLPGTPVASLPQPTRTPAASPSQAQALTIAFARGSSSLTAEDDRMPDEAVAAWRSGGTVRIEIADLGRTSASQHPRLAQRRLAQLTQELAQRGAPAGAIAVVPEPSSGRARLAMR